MTQAQTELPRRVELELIAAAAIGSERRVRIRNGRRIVGAQVIERRCSHAESDAERRSLNRTEDDTQLHVETGTRNLARIGNGDGFVQRNRLSIFHHLGNRLAILAIALVVNIVQADGQTEINAIVDITRDIEVVLADVALMGAVELVVAAVEIGILEEVQLRRIDIVQLVA